MIIGLTGNIGSGKSTVARQLKKLGARVIDTDVIARNIVKPGKPALKEIVETFGPGILNSNAELNRKALAEIVFKDNKAIQKLNSIMHPRIIEEVKKSIWEYKNHRGPRAPALVVEAPLLFETGLDKLVDEIWLVTVELPVQISRIVKRDNTNEENARHRISNQIPQENKIQKSHRIIDNSDTYENTINQVTKLWKKHVQPHTARGDNVW